jgi:hypothetical protein
MSRREKIKRWAMMNHEMGGDIIVETYGDAEWKEHFATAKILGITPLAWAKEIAENWLDQCQERDSYNY